MVITGWLCLWWAGQWLCLQGGWAPVPRLTSRLPEDCDAHGIDFGPGQNAAAAPVGRIPSQRRVQVLNLPASFQPPIPPA